MIAQSKLTASLLCAVSVVALSSAARAQDQGGPSPETVVVTGSRVIADIANSPTPITAISTQQLLQSTPVDVPSALNKLPVFYGSTTPGDGNSGDNKGKYIGNVLDLRNFGAQRTLVLLDGHRQAPSYDNGTVNVDTLPQTLMTRVDVVTGGASAVYGSDAVTGVVNFILNKHFSGVKVEANAGITNFGDGAEQQTSIAAGTDLFGGRGHVEGSVRWFHQDPVLLLARPWGPATSWTATGSGTKAQPIVGVNHAVFNNFAYGGLISNCGGCAANGQQFVSNGVLGPFVSGVNTYASTIKQGGDGVTTQASTFLGAQVSYQDFERFSYNINDNVTAYVQVIAAQGRDYGYHVGNYVQTATGIPNFVFANNPFLSPQAQAALANPTGKFEDTQYFEYPRYKGYIQGNLSRNLSLQGGLDGTAFGKYDWDIYFSHNETRLKMDQPTDQSNAKLAAAMDAVINPANGQIVCQVSLTQYASLYPGCVPMNRFGPTATSQSAYDYMLTDNYQITKQQMDVVSGSISGPVFDLPAGPVKAALSGEYRTLNYSEFSNQPDGFVDCTGLRLCVPNMPQTMHGIYLGVPKVSENVFEFAGEANVPLLKDLPLVQSLDLNLAGRYTDYSISGAVETWKIGIDYHVNSDVHLRATTSVDIRAPTLYDLYGPQVINHTGFSDAHTGNQYQQVITVGGGNPDLVPEVARTYTAGFVLTPSFVPGLTFSVDYYSIVLKNAISNVSGTSSSVASVCEASGGTSPICALYVRPLPFSDHSAANYPTTIYTQNLNASQADTGGVDVEANYGFDLADIWDSAPGSIVLRSLLSYQPNNNSYSFPTAPVTTSGMSHGRVMTFVTYNVGPWSFTLDDRWSSKRNMSNQPGIVFYAEPYAKALNYLDLNVSKKFAVDGSEMEGYLNVQNLLNTPPPIAPQANNIPGYQPYGDATRTGQDNLGRYFTIGIRATF